MMEQTMVGVNAQNWQVFLRHCYHPECHPAVSYPIVETIPGQLTDWNVQVRTTQ